MPTPKTYLNVPYAQKDAAKALGARWDAAQKKWYVPTGKDLALFAQWSMADGSPALPLATPAAAGVFTYPSIASFVPYGGDAPPWE